MELVLPFSEQFNDSSVVGGIFWYDLDSEVDSFSLSDFDGLL